MTYEYACQACGHTWEAEQSIKDAPLKECASCGAPKAKRLVSGGTGFLLKGGGWYADGYGSSSASKSNGDSEGASAKSGADATAKKAEPSTTESKSSDAKSGEPSAKPSTESTSTPKSSTGTSAAS
jgi:putative FmdB family regulatory protein